MIDPLEIIVIVVILFSLGGAGYAIAYMLGRRRKMRSLPVKTEPAVLIGIDCEDRQVNENFTSETVVAGSHGRVSDYSARFRLKDNRRITFKVKRKYALTFHDGDAGHLTYQGERFIGFSVTGKTNPATETYFPGRRRIPPTVLVYGEARQIGLSVLSDKPVRCDKTDLERLAKDLLSDDTDWFLVLTDKGGRRLQIERDGPKDIICTYASGNDETIDKCSLATLAERLNAFLNFSDNR